MAKKELAKEWNREHSKIWHAERTRLENEGKSPQEAKNGAKILAASKKAAFFAKKMEARASEGHRWPQTHV